MMRLSREGTRTLRAASSLPVPELTRDVALALTWVVLALGVGIRLAPLGFAAVWGSDSGEYYYLTERLVSEARIRFAYDGWGIAYPYFQGMFVLTGAVVATTGLPLFPALETVTPVVAGLIPLGVLLIVHQATGSRLAAVVAGAFAAVTAPNVIVTSHAMPGSLGHVLVLGGLLVVLRAYRVPRHLALLVPLGLALVVTHHLSTYFLVGILAGTAFLRELGSARPDASALRVELPAIGGLLTLALVYWLGVADVFRERIVGDAFDADPFLTAAAFGLALALLPGLVAARRRLAPRLTWRPHAPGARRALVYGVSTYATIVGGASLFIVVGFPATNITVTWATTLFVLAPGVMVALATVGAGAVKLPRDGFVLWGWAAAVTVSLVFSAVTGNRVLFPYRHIDYLAEAWAAVAGVGALVALAYVGRARPFPRVRQIAAAGLVAAILVGAVLSYPTRDAVGGFEEAVTDEEWAAVLWARDNLPPGSTIAADHRVSSLLFGVAGMRATWDYTYWTYHAETAEGAKEELRSVDIPSGEGARIDYVFLSPVIREGVILVQWENAEPMTERAYRKFFDETAHFEEVYGADDVHIFRVRWESD